MTTEELQKELQTFQEQINKLTDIVKEYLEEN